MAINLHTVSPVRYTKEETDITERTIIATAVPGNIRAIDVSDLPSEQQEEICEYYEEYSEYLTQHLKTAFSFEDWLSQSKGVDFTPKWRTFKPSQLEVLK